MGENATNETLTPSEIIENLRSKVDAMPDGATRSRYAHALSLYSSFLSTRPVSASLEASPEEKMEEMLGFSDWLISLCLSSTPLKTSLLYIDIISSLYHSCAKSGLWPATKTFSRLKAILKEKGESFWNKGIDEEVFERVLELTKSASRLEGELGVAADIMLYSLINGCMPLMEVAMLTRDRVAPDEESRAIAARRLGKSNRKYVFPLRQSVTTPRQVSLHVQQLLAALFRSRRLPVADNAFDIIESLWAYAALRLNIPPADILAHIGHVPAALPILRLLNVADKAAPQQSILNSKFSILNSEIAKLFLSNPFGWYALNMRPGIKFPMLDLRIKAQKTHIPPLTLFYPCEEIARVIKKKVVLKSRPVIPQVVFFRTRATDVVRIISRIGDIAWCYTTTGRPGAPYARIAQQQFELFQQTIARFTPDFEVAESGALELRENDRVKVIGGLFSGKEGEFETVVQEDNNTVYRIRLLGDNGIDWRVSLDPRLVQPITH